MKQIRARIVAAALALAAQAPWPQVSLAAIADEAGVSLADLYDHFEDKSDILTAYGRTLDRQVLAAVAAGDKAQPESESEPEPEPDLAVRDRLFDILMERFDLLNQDREAVLSILGSLYGDPKQAVIGLPHLGRSMSWMLEAAGAGTTGLRGAAKIVGLTGVYLCALKSWMSDDSPDLAATMAALDKALGRAERAAGFLGV